MTRASLTFSSALVWIDNASPDQPLMTKEREEAEGLVNLSDFLTILRLHAERMTQ